VVKPIVVEERFELVSDACTLWPLITDTERLNRAIGNEPVKFTPSSTDSAARFTGRTNLGGFDVEYEEHPYEWAYLEHFRVLRRMKNGPVEEMAVGYHLSPGKGTGTDVVVRFSMKPRLFFLAPIIRYKTSAGARRIAEEFKRIDPTVIQSAAFGAASERFRKLVPTDIGEAVLELIEHGEDIDVAKIRPFELAAEKRLDRLAILEACLHAVRVGLLDLGWDVVCPSCRVASATLPSLSELGEHGACQVCDLEFALDLDSAVEATFSPPDAIRMVDRGPYCSGGPSRTPHVISQLVIPHQGASTFRAPDEPGDYRLFLRGGATASVLVDGAGATSRVTRFNGDSLTERRIHLAPRAELSLENHSNVDLHAKIEQMMWSRNAATARDVTSLAAFRAQFARDTLKPGLSLKVSRVAILFSDLFASTQLYADVGDGQAFRLVQDHFDLLGEIIAKRHGSIVKTIGDAVMAVFADEVDAALAALDIAGAFSSFRLESELRKKTDIKLGMYAGACFAVTANGVLDYFGQSVNIAARLQGEAQSGEVVLESELVERLRARNAIPVDANIESYSAKLKGVDQPIDVSRIRIARSS
jgi:adenylate cyclase